MAERTRYFKENPEGGVIRMCKIMEDMIKTGYWHLK